MHQPADIFLRRLVVSEPAAATFKTLSWLITLSIGLICSSPAKANEDSETATAFPAEDIEFFEKEIRPLLVEHCYSCHSSGAEKLQAGLYLDSRHGHLTGGDSGAAVVPGDLSSLLLESVRYESYEMPPKGKLPDDAIAKLERWVEIGAPWPKEAAPSAEPRADEFDLEARAAQHWAWQPMKSPSTPTVENRAWPRSEIDFHILSGLEHAGLQPAPDADRLAIVRRLYMDLIGLPPTVDQIAEFQRADPDVAVEQLVDCLLDSPAFGERWGRHWLDLVRYAESRGHEFDNDTPNAFQYRDYVIRALNLDIPYDQFIREHIAGDLIENPRLHPTEHFNESILGTGFWFFGEWVHSPVDIRKDEADRFDNMVDVMSKAFLGVTVACARCHDHKFDAISTRDYYSLTGFLQSSDYRQVRFESLQQNKEVADKLTAIDQHYQSELLKLLASQNIHLPKNESLGISHPAVVVDYANVAPDQFMQDGVIFQQGPKPAGSLSLSADGKLKVARTTAAANDSFWHGLKSTTVGALQNNSRVDALPKSGRTLRTPTFELTDGQVSCFVQGRGHVVACVDSHRLVFGPLHGETIREIKEGETVVTINLSRYIGHRLHLEFVPADEAELSVRLVTQGLTDEQLKAVEQQLLDQSAELAPFADAAEDFLNGEVDYTKTVFADFESGVYGDWTVEGEAFGDIPQTANTIANYQGNVNHRGQFFVNSHNIRNPGSDMQRGDKLTGTLTSPEFLIAFDELEFLVGGGAHAGKTCVNLLIDGQAVLSATGKNNNRMELTVWDVRPFAGKQARLQVVDAHEGGWGNIGIDEITFVNVQERAGKSDEANRLITEWKAQRDRLKQEVRWESRTAPAMIDGSGEDDHVLIRGNASKPGKTEPRHFLTAISGDQPLDIAFGSGRLQLAEAINDPANPLTSRVIVNRIWHHLMGRGIVPTVDDFGVLGQRPTNLPLLDHLALKFLDDGRSIKQMIRYIVLSRSYQISSYASEQGLAQDPNNLLWHYKPPKRLEGEAIRDSLLALSGQLKSDQFGPPVPIHLTSFMDGRGRPSVNGPLDGDGRRTIYVAVRRNFLSPFMLAFDTPVPFSTMGRRNVSNVPAQALILMNDPFVVQQAKGWAERAMKVSDDPTERIRWMYASAFAREPSSSELDLSLRYVDVQSGAAAGNKDAADVWQQLAHVLINTKEFIFVR